MFFLWKWCCKPDVVDGRVHHEMLQTSSTVKVPAEAVTSFGVPHMGLGLC